MATDRRAALAELRSGTARLAEALYTLETSSELALLRDASQLRGRSGERAAEAVAAATGLWARYPLLTDAVERGEAAEAADDDDTLAAVFDGPTASGGPPPLALLASLTAESAAAERAVAEVAGAWSDVLPRLDAVRSQAAALTVTATQLGIADDPDLATAGRIVEHLVATVAADPLGVDPSPAEAAVARAEDRIGALDRRRTALPHDLATAAATLAELTGLVADGRAALERAQARVADTSTLLGAVDTGVVDGSPRALRPWLARLDALAAEGRWRDAAAGLEHWRAAAEGWVATARQVVAANRAPVEARDQLRGLLDAYRAKAAARGRIEDTTLAAAHRAADDAVRARPCDLTVAAALVRAYGDAVNGPGGVVDP
jgi:hypothetical protein